VSVASRHAGCLATQGRTLPQFSLTHSSHWTDDMQNLPFYLQQNPGLFEYPTRASQSLVPVPIAHKSPPPLLSIQCVTPAYLSRMRQAREKVMVQSHRPAAAPVRPVDPSAPLLLSPAPPSPTTPARQTILPAPPLPSSLRLEPPCPPV
jgi:hypothetical protein